MSETHHHAISVHSRATPAPGGPCSAEVPHGPACRPYRRWRPPRLEGPACATPGARQDRAEVGRCTRLRSGAVGRHPLPQVDEDVGHLAHARDQLPAGQLEIVHVERLGEPGAAVDVGQLVTATGTERAPDAEPAPAVIRHHQPRNSAIKRACRGNPPARSPSHSSLTIRPYEPTQSRRTRIGRGRLIPRGYRRSRSERSVRRLGSQSPLPSGHSALSSVLPDPTRTGCRASFGAATSVRSLSGCGPDQGIMRSGDGIRAPSTASGTAGTVQCSVEGCAVRPYATAAGLGSSGPHGGVSIRGRQTWKWVMVTVARRSGGRRRDSWLSRRHAMAVARFAAFYKTELAGQVRRAALLIGDRDDARDLVHDAFIEVYRRWDELDEPGPTSTEWC